MLNYQQEGFHEIKAIDDGFVAWNDFDNGQDWSSIDFEDDDEQISTVTDCISLLNIYDIDYASECRRIYRAWNTMSLDDRQLYMDHLLELDHFDSVIHHDSDY